jgi:hypothetical protein
MGHVFLDSHFSCALRLAQHQAAVPAPGVLTQFAWGRPGRISATVKLGSLWWTGGARACSKPAWRTHMPQPSHHAQSNTLNILSQSHLCRTTMMSHTHALIGRRQLEQVQAVAAQRHMQHAYMRACMPSRQRPRPLRSMCTGGPQQPPSPAACVGTPRTSISAICASISMPAASGAPASPSAAACLRSAFASAAM